MIASVKASERDCASGVVSLNQTESAEISFDYDVLN